MQSEMLYGEVHVARNQVRLLANPNKEMNPANNHVSELGSGSFHRKLLDGWAACPVNSLTAAF